MEINSKTIHKSILGQIIHLTKAIQIENRIDINEAKIKTYKLLKNGIDEIFNLNDKDIFLQNLNQLIEIYKRENKDYTLILQIKDIYKESKIETSK